MTDPVRIVAAGYDALGWRYGAWRSSVGDDPATAWLETFEASLPAGRILDLGCGAGMPATAFMTRRGRDVTGVDVSEAQLALAREAFPEVRFVRADMMELEVEPGSVAGVVALFSMIHLPRERLRTLFARIRRWLIPGGGFMATFMASDNPGAVEEWLGTQMFFSGYEPDTTMRLLRETGFVLERDEVVRMQEPEGEVSFHWVLARS